MEWQLVRVRVRIRVVVDNHGARREGWVPIPKGSRVAVCEGRAAFGTGSGLG